MRDQGDDHGRGDYVPLQDSPVAQALDDKRDGRASGYLSELGRVGPLAGPVALQSALAFSANLVSLGFVGHLGPLTLSQAVLGLSCYNVSGVSVLLGLATGMETQAGQAYGAKKYHLLGTIMQRAMLICSVAFCLIMCLWSQLNPILKAAGQDPHIVDGAVYFLWLNAPALFCYFMSECMKRYLLAQGEVQTPTVAMLVGAGMAPVYNYLFVQRLHWGLGGAAAANNCVQATSALLIAGLLVRREWGKRGDAIRTWTGWSWNSFQEWGGYLKLALPSMAATSLEWWLYEGLILLAGVLPDAEIAVAVMGIGFNTTAFTYTVSLGISGAASTRVANELGAGSATRARIAFQTVVALEAALMAVVIALGISLASPWAHLFTSDEKVATATVAILPIVFLSEMGDGFNGACGGVLRGAGRQLTGSYINGASYWGIGLPLCWFLAFKQDLGVTGLWYGLLSTTSLTGLLMLVASCGGRGRPSSSDQPG
ncbi:hypothetical protein WJX73_007196 [Symbiochloris irregularis]|uniref:Protein DETOXIFICATION n=1 Tax=Symbiochloris irregularis TaxID=706552 RepID=A0AAW1P2F9_9CHLO